MYPVANVGNYTVKIDPETGIFWIFEGDVQTKWNFTTLNAAVRSIKASTRKKKNVAIPCWYINLHCSNGEIRKEIITGLTRRGSYWHFLPIAVDRVLSNYSFGLISLEEPSEQALTLAKEYDTRVAEEEAARRTLREELSKLKYLSRQGFRLHVQDLMDKACEKEA